MKMLLILSLISFQALAQTTTTAAPAATSSAGNTSQLELPFFSWQKLKERTKISYFSETLGPSVKKWDDNEVNVDGTRSNMPVRTFHSLNNRFRMVDQLSLYVSSRFVSVIGDRNELRETDDQNVLQMDDWQFGLSYDFYKSQNLSYSQRLTHRHPFSTYSKNSGIDSQIEWQHAFTWQPKTGWRVIHWNTYRYYQYEARSENERYRINFTTLLNYDINDKWLTQVQYEWDMQHRNPNNGPQEKAWNFFKKYENHLSMGVGYSPVRNLTFIPFIRTMELADIRNENTIVGMFVLGKVL